MAKASIQEKKTDIKIFVSHRIDLDSETIDNPLYIPMRCGAVYDQREGVALRGDDTGDHISEKRLSFNEFTVQYWAWKNASADYIGLCHYRRYLSFSPKRYKTDDYHMVYEPFFAPPERAEKYGLADPAAMTEDIQSADAVVAEAAPVARIGRVRTVRELWDSHIGLFFAEEPIAPLLNAIDRTAPQYSESARAYLAGTMHRGYNCFILRADLFDRLCRFQFPILFRIEGHLDLTGYTRTMMRTPAFCGEILYGIFIHHLLTAEKRLVKEKQLIFFNYTGAERGRFGRWKSYIRGGADIALRTAVDPFLPRGSTRREMVKKFYYTLTHQKKRKES